MGQIKEDFEQWVENNYPLYVYRDGTVELTLEVLSDIVEQFILEKADEANRNTRSEENVIPQQMPIKMPPPPKKPRMTPEEFDRIMKRLSKD